MSKLYAWLKDHVAVVWAGIGVVLVVLVRVLFHRAKARETRAEEQVRIDWVKAEVEARKAQDAEQAADAIRSRRVALEAEIREEVARTSNESVETLSADELADRWVELRAGGKK
jgi:hypothetical protein